MFLFKLCNFVFFEFMSPAETWNLRFKAFCRWSRCERRRPPAFRGPWGIGFRGALNEWWCDTEVTWARKWTDWTLCFYRFWCHLQHFHQHVGFVFFRQSDIEINNGNQSKGGFPPSSPSPTRFGRDASLGVTASEGLCENERRWSFGGIAVKSWRSNVPWPWPTDGRTGREDGCSRAVRNQKEDGG